MSSTSRTVRANIFFAEKDQALREDVHRLGELVGEIVREQGGEALFDLVETARKAAIAHREGDTAPTGAQDPARRRSRRAPRATSSARSRRTSRWSTWPRRCIGCVAAARICAIRRRRSRSASSTSCSGSRPKASTRTRSSALLNDRPGPARVHRAADRGHAPHAAAQGAQHRAPSRRDDGPVPHAAGARSDRSARFARR